MKKDHLLLAAWAVLFLLLIQLVGTLIESIYILDLMNTSLDEKALGILFFFTPALLFFYRGKSPRLTVWILSALLILSRGCTPYLNTLGRMLAAGVGTGAALSLVPFMLTASTARESRTNPGRWVSGGLALAVGLSVLLRTVGYGLDYSLHPEGGWSGWILGAVLGYLLTHLDWKRTQQISTESRSPVLPQFGMLLVIGLVWFAFSAPAVISRWTEGNYQFIVLAVSALALGWVGSSFCCPGLVKRVSPALRLVWNLAFTASLLLTLLVHRIIFPQSPEATAVVVRDPTWIQKLPLVLTLVFFPVLFLDLQVFTDRIRQEKPGVRDLIPGILLGSLVLVALVFMQVFTNVWGYVEPISPWFRNKFWLPYLLLAGMITALAGWKASVSRAEEPDPVQSASLFEALFLSALFLGTAVSVLVTTRIRHFSPRDSSLVVMTYNIQQANNIFGERSYRDQLELIRQVEPDILALQESDSTRVSLNNNDFVRYFAGKLGYYSYYGPRTVTGTYGTAILARFPLHNTRSIFSYSDLDEIGTAVVEVVIGEQVFNIFNVHPDGSDRAMQVWAETITDRARGQTKVIILGDFNLRDYEAPYRLIAAEFSNAWESVYPSKISPDGVDMSGENRIDHIFFSPDLEARNPVYILPPESATDHPVHWAEIIWKQ